MDSYFKSLEEVVPNIIINFTTALIDSFKFPAQAQEVQESPEIVQPAGEVPLTPTEEL